MINSKSGIVEDVCIGGWRVSEWIQLFEMTYTLTSIGFIFNGWPDGQCYFEQDSLMVAVFGVIREEKINGLGR